MNNEIKNYLKENYPNNNYIFGPNWAIIKPTNDELENEDKNSHYHSIEKECILCHSKFSYGQTKKILCGCCKIITQCINSKCNKVFEIDLMNYSGTKQKEIIDSLKNNKKIFISCSKSCSNMDRIFHGKCPTCGAEDVDIYNKRCTYCANRELNAPINCPIHGYQEKSFGGKCLLCINSKKDYEKQSKIRVENINRQISNGERLYWPGGKEFIPCFIEKDNLRYYYMRDADKFIEVSKLIQKLNNNEIDQNRYGFYKILNEWYFKKINILNGDIVDLNFKNNFIEINDILCYKINNSYESVKSVINKLENGIYNIKNFPNWNKRHCKNCNTDKWHYYTKCLNCDTTNKLKSGGGKPNFTYEDVFCYEKEPVNKIIQKLESSEYDLKDFPGWSKRWCENCNKYEYYYENECLVCGNINEIIDSNFTVVNGKKFYKNGEDVETLANKILSGECDLHDYPGFNIRFGHVCYGTEDIITGEHYYLSGSNFQLVEGVEFILNPMTGQREPSEEFYKRYQDKINSVNPSEEVQNLINNEDFTLEPIITTGQDSWSRSRTDKYLSDKGYGWIVYIKLLNGHPWIVGKTGTKAVFQSPIDFDFIITDQRNPNNPDYAGPGREYARRYFPEKSYSDFDYVLCRNFLCVQDALIFEEFIAQEYGLFMS